jgi:diguanylate cyclase (GGDEF)-like protein
MATEQVQSRRASVQSVRFSARFYVVLILLQFAAGIGSLAIYQREQALLRGNPRWGGALAAELSGAQAWEQGLDQLLLFSIAVGSLYVLRLRVLMRRQEKTTSRMEAELRFERSTLEQRIESRTVELRAEVEERRRAERLNRGRSRILEKLATNADTQSILALLVQTVEAQRSVWACGLHLLDEDGTGLWLAAATGLPESLRKYLENIEVEFTDAPEAQAVATRAPATAAELEKEHKPWSGLLVANGIRSVYSSPFFSAAERVLGTLTIYSRLFYEPTPGDREDLESASKMASVVLEHRRIHSELVTHASRDHLTGLINRRVGEARLGEAIERAQQAEVSVAVLWLDMNRFKHINDEHGHAFGDAVLQEVAARLTSNLRANDTVARMGGDEFMVILENVSDREVAERIARLLAQVLRQPFQQGEVEIEMAASVGISLCPQDGTSVDQLEQNADRAMYEAKWNGLPVAAFSPHMSAQTEERRGLEHALRSALARNEDLEVHYQPQYGAKGELRALEALLRFRHPEFGPIPPSTFIPVAEATDLILPLSEWVLRTACRQCHSWQVAGCEPVPVAVNISPRQFTREDFAESVAAILKDVELQPGMLELELTETLVMDDFNESARQMSRLKTLGVSIAMDDFGTGYSSLSYLHRLPIDVLKIDRSFVEKLAEQDGTRPIVEAVLSMAHKLGLEVVAEGVETEHQMQILQEAGCDSLQGYFFARPQPVASLLPLLSGYSPRRFRGTEEGLVSSEL